MKTLILILLLPLSVLGQTRTVTLDEISEFNSKFDSVYSNFSVDSLNIHFEKCLNEYRLSKGVPLISYNSDLNVVSKEQSDFCSVLGKLTHYQYENKSKESPEDRMTFYGFNSDLIGEDLIKYPSKLTFFNYYKSSMSIYDVISKSFIDSWSKSEGHNAMLLTSNGKMVSLSITRKGDSFYGCYVILSEFVTD
jgi:uncharacterized protein YkwD